MHVTFKTAYLYHPWRFNSSACDAVSLREKLPTFQRTAFSSILRARQSTEDEGTMILWKVNSYLPSGTASNIEDLNLEHHNREDLHSCTLSSLFIWYCTNKLSTLRLVSITNLMHNSFILSALNRCTVRPLTDSDDTRCCNNTIWPPEDEHSIARNMSGIIM
jgi:hypothetical protein